MDEMVFRANEKLNSLQVHAEIVIYKIKDFIQICYDRGPQLLNECWNNSTIVQLRSNTLNLFQNVLNSSKDLVQKVDAKQFWVFLIRITGRNWTRREIGIACTAFIIGSLTGAIIGIRMRKKKSYGRYMKAIGISDYSGIKYVKVFEDAFAPYKCGDNEVLINVKAASVQIIDGQICHGYGKNLSKILRQHFCQTYSNWPIKLGRDCTGIITDIGRNVRRLEVGDEVWITVPFWADGTMCQTVLVPENRVALKPKNASFEGSCSVPYAGSIALAALNEGKIDMFNASEKSVFVQHGCTPVGCVLTQLLHRWGSQITITCHKRAVPVAKALGADKIISLETYDDDENVNNIYDLNTTQENFEHSSILYKELEANAAQFDVIIFTKNEVNLKLDEFNIFCKPNGKILTTFPPSLPSDSYGCLRTFMWSWYLRIKILFSELFNLPLSNYDEAHLCHVTLEKLAEYVEDGDLQTVVDKVFQPKDIEIALQHVQSLQSIGSTIITFR